MSGFSIGVMYSWSESVLRILKKLAPFQKVATFMQHAVAKTLSDKGQKKFIFISEMSR